MLDYKKRELKIGEKVRIQEDIPSPDGMLYKNTLVKLNEFNYNNNKVRVTDSLGKVWWIDPSQVSASYL
jgi:hypothetical protein